MESRELEKKLVPPFQPLTPEEVLEAKRAYEAVAETILEQAFRIIRRLRELLDEPDISPALDLLVWSASVRITDYQIMRRAIARIGVTSPPSCLDVRDAIAASKMKYEYELAEEHDSDDDWTDIEVEEEIGVGELTGFTGGRPETHIFNDAADGDNGA